MKHIFDKNKFERSISGFCQTLVCYSKSNLSESNQFIGFFTVGQESNQLNVFFKKDANGEISLRSNSEFDDFNLIDICEVRFQDQSYLLALSLYGAISIIQDYQSSRKLIFEYQQINSHSPCVDSSPMLKIAFLASSSEFYIFLKDEFSRINQMTGTSLNKQIASASQPISNIQSEMNISFERNVIAILQKNEVSIIILRIEGDNLLKSEYKLVQTEYKDWPETPTNIMRDCIHFSIQQLSTPQSLKISKLYIVSKEWLLIISCEEGQQSIKILQVLKIPSQFGLPVSVFAYPLKEKDIGEIALVQEKAIHVLSVSSALEFKKIWKSDNQICLKYQFGYLSSKKVHFINFINSDGSTKYDKNTIYQSKLLAFTLD